MQNFIHISKNLLNETLKTPATDGLRLLDPLKSIALQSGMPMKILEEVNAYGDFEKHLHEEDLWLCLQGNLIFTLSGKLENERQRTGADGKNLVPNEFTGDRIIDGEEVELEPGDWLWIPRGVPHHHRSSRVTRLAIIKIPNKNS